MGKLLLLPVLHAILDAFLLTFLLLAFLLLTLLLLLLLFLLLLFLLLLLPESRGSAHELFGLQVQSFQRLLVQLTVAGNTLVLLELANGLLGLRPHFAIDGPRADALRLQGLLQFAHLLGFQLIRGNLLPLLRLLALLTLLPLLPHCFTFTLLLLLALLFLLAAHARLLLLALLLLLATHARLLLTLLLLLSAHAGLLLLSAGLLLSERRAGK
jgi:hypothetical protein